MRVCAFFIYFKCVHICSDKDSFMFYVCRLPCPCIAPASVPLFMQVKSLHHNTLCNMRYPSRSGTVGYIHSAHVFISIGPIFVHCSTSKSISHTILRLNISIFHFRKRRVSLETMKGGYRYFLLYSGQVTISESCRE